MLFCFLFAVSAFSQEAQKFDEFENINCEEYLLRMDNAFTHAHNDPTLMIYVLIYEGKEARFNDRKNETEIVLPPFGSAKAKITSMKNYLRFRRFPGKRFSFVKAGFRENASVEIWTVPSGAAAPKPTPTLKKMRYRKGKAVGFCTDCCL